MKYILTLLLIICTNVSAKDITFLIPYSAGGPIDIFTRTIVKNLNADKKYNFRTEFKLGAGGAVAANHLASIKNETSFMLIGNAIVTTPLLVPVNYKLTDFQLIDFIGGESLLVVVRNDEKIKNFNQFINTETNMHYGSSGVGSSQHIAGAVIAKNKSNFIHVPYKGSSSALLDLLNGELKWAVDSELNLNKWIAEGKLLPIAISGRNRIPSYPNIPTLKELNFDDRSFYRWIIMISNKNADPAIVDYVKTKLNSPQLKLELEQLGLNTDKPDLNNFLSKESIKVQSIIKDFQIQEK